MEIKPGYKQTEIGVIPDDWEVKELKEITSGIGDGIHSTPEYSQRSDYFFINGNNLANGRILFDDNTKSISEREYSKYKTRLTDRTLLLSINGTIGNIAKYNGERILLGKSAAYMTLTVPPKTAPVLRQ
jgi:type I restriction enzyme S subunit